MQVLHLFPDLMKSMSVFDRFSFVIIVVKYVTCNTFATEKQSLHPAGNQMH